MVDTKKRFSVVFRSATLRSSPSKPLSSRLQVPLEVPPCNSRTSLEAAVAYHFTVLRLEKKDKQNKIDKKDRRSMGKKKSNDRDGSSDAGAIVHHHFGFQS